MNRNQARQMLNLKLQTRVNEAKCKAMAEDRHMVNMFWQDMQQLNYENIHNKLAIAYASKKLSAAHHTYLVEALHQYTGAIKSNKKLLRTVNSQIDQLMNKERDLLELQEETALGIKDSMDLEIDSIIEDSARKLGDDDEDVLPFLLPPVPNDKVQAAEKKRSISFGDVIIKTVDEAEDERKQEDTTCGQEDFIDDENVEQII
jgi:hypothetical protein